MNYDLIKTVLLEIIKEAANLNPSELERVGNTNVYVKKGRTKEFDVRAYEYYEQKNNVIINENIDYITEVYEELKNEVREENNEYYDSKSYDLAQATSGEIARFNALVGSLNTINSNYEKINKDIQNTSLIANALESQRKLEELMSQRATLLEHKKIILDQIVAIKNTVNSKINAVIDEQMDFILTSYRNTRSGTEIAFGIDGKSILKSAKEEYDNLYVLKQIINNVKDEDLICVNDLIFVNEIQKEKVAEILNNTEIFKRLKPLPKKEEPKPELPNADIINAITAKLRELESRRQTKGSKKVANGMYVTASNLAEYNNLISILRILNKANNSKYALTDVWGIAKASSEDVRELKELLNNTNLFNEHNPNLKAFEENQKIINNLENYIDEIAKRVSDDEHRGFNVDMKETTKIGEKQWAVLPEDVYECNRIIEIIKILSRPSSNYLKVGSIGYAPNFEDIPLLKELASKTKYFAGETLKEEPEPVVIEIPEVTEPQIEHSEEPNLDNSSNEDINNPQINADFIAKIDGEISNHEESLKTASPETQAKIKELINVLNEIKKYLVNAQTSPDLRHISGTLVAENDEENYRKAFANYREIKENLNKEEKPIIGVTNDFNQVDQETDSKINKDALAEVEDAINEIRQNMDGKSEEEKAKAEKTLNALLDMQKYLKKARTAKDLCDVDGYTVAKEDEENFRKAKAIYANAFERALTSTPKIRKQKVTVRKLYTKGKEFLKKNRKLIIGLGICATMATLSLATLPEILVFANSCNAVAFPASAGFFNSLSSLIASVSNISFVNGLWLNGSGAVINAGAVATKAGSALGIAALNLINLGASTTIAVNLLKPKNEEEHLNEHVNKSNLKEKILTLGSYIKSRARGLKHDLNNAADEFTENFPDLDSAENAEIAEEIVNEISEEASEPAQENLQELLNPAQIQAINDQLQQMPENPDSKVMADIDERVANFYKENGGQVR